MAKKAGTNARRTVQHQQTSETTPSSSTSSLTTSSSTASSSSSSSTQNSRGKLKSSGRLLVPDLIARIAVPLYFFSITATWLLGILEVIPEYYRDSPPSLLRFHRGLAVLMYVEMMLNWLCIRYIDSSYPALLKTRWRDQQETGQRGLRGWMAGTWFGSAGLTRKSSGILRTWFGSGGLTAASSCSGEDGEMSCPNKENDEKLSCHGNETEKSSYSKTDNSEKTLSSQNEDDNKSCYSCPSQSEWEGKNSGDNSETSATEGKERKQDTNDDEGGLRKRSPWKQDCKSEERSQKHEREKGRDDTSQQTTQEHDEDAEESSGGKFLPKQEEKRAEERSLNKEPWKPEFKPPPQMTYPYWSWIPCYVCRIVRPPRCHHCAICNTCVLKRDHHCFFAGNCVGWKNQRHFLVFAVWAFLSCLYATLQSFPYLHAKLWPEMRWFDLLGPVVLVRWLCGYTPAFICLYVCLQTLLFYFILLTFEFTLEHVSLIIRGLTSFEVSSLKKNVEVRERRGVGQKVRAVMGRNWALSFLCPLHWLFEAEEDPENWPSVSVYRH